METSSKNEILNGLKELKDKGVSVVVHDSFIDRSVAVGFTVNSGGFVLNGHQCHHNENNDVVVNVKQMKKASDLTIHIYQNSSEDEIIVQINSIKDHLKRIERDSKTSAIVEFLQQELSK